MATKTLFLMRKAPYGTIYTYEGLETMLIFAAYEQEISVAFLDDGVYSIMKDQKTELLEIKDFGRTFPALEDFDIERLYIHDSSMKERGVTEDDLVVKCEVLNDAGLKKLMEEQDVILPF